MGSSISQSDAALIENFLANNKVTTSVSKRITLKAKVLRRQPKSSMLYDERTGRSFWVPNSSFEKLEGGLVSLDRCYAKGFLKSV